MASTSDADERNDVAETLTPPPSSSSIQKPSLPTLPFELVVEILSLLPVKSLTQLRCVCKSWKYLISDPKFAKKQLRASMSITRRHHLMLTFIDRPSNFIFIDYSLSPFFAEGTITSMPMQLDYPLEITQTSFVVSVGSCHGILCFHHDQGVVLLWNPSIRKFTKLPPLEKEGGGYSFDFSFGYDNFSDTYKVVAVSRPKFYLSNGIGAYKFQVMIHTLGTNSWRKMLDLPFGTISETGKFVSGTINWVASRDRHSPEVILSLDLEKESYRELLPPDFGGVAIAVLDLEVFNDCLSIISHGDAFTDVWLMKDFGNKESWTKLVRAPNNGGIESWSYVTALYVSEDDQVLLDINQKFVIYNFREGTFKDCSNQNINGTWMKPNVYLESLISPCF